MPPTFVSYVAICIAFLSLSSVTNATPSAISAFPSDWILKGCYIDSTADRSLQGANTESDDMTNDNCITFCANQGFNLAGTEFGAECYCDFVINVARQSDSDCNTPCNGDDSETCGAANRLTVYQYNGSAPLGPLTNPGPPGWSSVGCYTDDVAARTLSTLVSTDGGASNMSVVHCTDACNAGGFKFAGMEFGQECYCDNKLENGAVPATSGCSSPCLGNVTEACGGSSRINIYELGANTITTAPVGGSGSSSSSTTSSPPTSSSMVSNLPANWKYRGCFVDPTDARIFTHEEPDNQDMTIESCVDACINLGYSVAGMEWGVQCFCDNFVHNGGNQTDDSECNMPCGGDANELCGQGNRLSVYSNATLQIFQPPTAQMTDLPGDWQYVGCISDNSIGNRSLPWQLILTSNNSASTCLKQCSDFGYTAGGMEFGDECYCGDPGDVAAAGATTEPESDCNMPCSGNFTFFCGAGNRLSYYEWQGSILTQFNYPQGDAAGLYEFFIGGLIVPLVSAQTITKKVAFLEKFGDTKNSTGAYELDPSLQSNFDAAWRTLHVATDVFCTAMIQLPDRVGRLLSVGGWSLNSLVGVRLYWPTGSPGVESTRDWQENVNELHLLNPRWYPSALVLANGSILVVGGENGSNGPPVPTMEILPPPEEGYAKFASWLNRTDPNNLYPFVCVLPTGGIFVQYYNEAIILDEETLDIVKQLPNVPGTVNDFLAGRNYPYEGTMVLMPQHAPYTDPLKIMICGGGTQAGTGPAIDNCVTIEPEVDGAEWVLERMPSKRVMTCMTALPDGTYLITNGAFFGAAGFGLGTDPNTNAVLYEPNKPVGQRMSVMANSTLFRLYHSESVLLSDGSVLISGSDPEDTRYPQEYRVEKFLPPYLTNPKTRPTYTIQSIDWAYGDKVDIDVTVHNNPISQVNISILAAEGATHGNNFGQRMLFPEFTCSGMTCTITAPPNANVWPPAWAQLFVLDDGMPSESQYIRIGGDPAGLGDWPKLDDFDTPGLGSAQVGGNTTVNS
ncbi:copper radical oxidase [Rhizodiscina lignyota]|uniref:Copper radical oxidase n=1 Tax=Rhizodiscina lignyota TaxID=1504668 RepID=A0A9P4M884_9PEZI|nr:copper radical oxidase [Rhizodiscina lignyota]